MNFVNNHKLMHFTKTYKTIINIVIMGLLLGSPLSTHSSNGANIDFGDVLLATMFTSVTTWGITQVVQEKNKCGKWDKVDVSACCFATVVSAGFLGFLYYKPRIFSTQRTPPLAPPIQTEQKKDLPSLTKELQLQYSPYLQLIDTYKDNQSDLHKHLNVLTLSGYPGYSAVEAYNGKRKSLDNCRRNLFDLIEKASQDNSIDLQPALKLRDDLCQLACLMTSSPYCIKACEEKEKRDTEAREKKENEDKEYRQTRNRVILSTLGVAAVVGLGALGYHHYYISELSRWRNGYYTQRDQYDRSQIALAATRGALDVQRQCIEAQKQALTQSLLVNQRLQQQLQIETPDGPCLEASAAAAE
jgi:hypothetical protein